MQLRTWAICPMTRVAVRSDAVSYLDTLRPQSAFALVHPAHVTLAFHPVSQSDGVVAGASPRRGAVGWSSRGGGIGSVGLAAAGADRRFLRGRLFSFGGPIWGSWAGGRFGVGR
jgi:hypothetical protein